MVNIPQFFQPQWQRGQPLDIQEEIALMGEESLFEVTLPVDTIVDLLKTPERFSDFISQVGIAHPDFVMMIDLMENHYELIIDQYDQIELPEEGSGRFSIPKAFTFIFNAQQVRALRQPVFSLQAPEAIISVSHVNNKGVKISDSVRHIKSENPHLSEKNKSRATIAEAIYPFPRLMSDYVKGDRFGLSQERGYNDFALWGLPSSLEAFYDLLIKGLANRQISRQFILDRVDKHSFYTRAYEPHLKGSLSVDALLDTTPPILPTYHKKPLPQEKSPKKNLPPTRPRRG